MNGKRPSPDRFAAALAVRLDQIVPRGLTVRSTRSRVDVHSSHDDRHVSAGADIITDKDGRTLEELVATAALSVLSGAQDGVMELLMQQWPIAPNGTVVYPDTQVQDGRLLMWFGDEREPVITLAPLLLDEIYEDAA